MKIFNHPLKIILSKKKLKITISFAAVLFSLICSAQVVKQTTTATLAKLPSVYNMAEFRKTAQYAKRKAAYDKVTTWPKYKNIKYSNNHTLKITYDREVNVNTKPPSPKKIGADKPTSSGGFNCITSNVQYTANSDNFLNNPYAEASAHIYPGACFTYANLTNGSWKEQQGARNSITIGTSNTNIKSGYHTYTQVNTPDVNHVNDAIAQLKRGFNGCANEDTYYQVTEVDNEAIYNLAIGAGASGYGLDVSNQYNTGNQSNHVHLTIDATKTLFTISTSIPDSGYFKDPSIEATQDLTVIGEVSYGIRILANADFQFTSQEEADNFKASYSGFGFSANLSVDYGTSSKNVTTTINANIIGGPGGTLVAYSLADLKKQITQIMGAANCNNAQPIKYQSTTMAGDVLNTTSETDQIPVRTCVPAGKGEDEIQSVIVGFGTGGDDKHAETRFLTQIFTGINSNINDGSKILFQNDYMGPQIYFPANSQPGPTTEVFLKPTKKVTLSNLTNGGGGFIKIVIPQGQNVSTDWWDISQVTIRFILKPSTANPNPQPIEVNKGSGYNLMNNPAVLKTNDINSMQLILKFDGSFNPL